MPRGRLWTSTAIVLACAAGIAGAALGAPFKALPATLVLSGGSGDAVAVSDARALYRKLVRAHVPAELRVYPHGTHEWKGAQRLAAERWIDGPPAAPVPRLTARRLTLP